MIPLHETDSSRKHRFFNRNINCLWIGQFISMCGDSALWTSIIFLVLALNPENAPAKAGFVAFLETVPFLLFAFAAGKIGDHFDRIKVLWISDIARALLLLIIPVVFWFNILEWWIVGVVAFGVGLFSSVFNPARDALIPELATGRNLMTVNSFFQTSSQFAVIAGTGFAAAFLGVSKVVGDTHDISRIVSIFTADAFTYIVSAAFLLSLKIPRQKRSQHKIETPQSHFKNVINWLKTNSLLKGLLFITAVDNLFIMGPATVGANLFVKETLGLGPESVALFEFTLAVGMLISALGILKWGSKIPKGKMVLAGILLDGLTFIPFYWIRSFPILLFAILIHSLTIPVIIVPRTTLIQENIANRQMTQAFALVNFTVFGFWSLSGLLTGFSAGWLEKIAGPHMAPPLLYLIAGTGGTVCGCFGFLFKDLSKAQ